MAPPLTLVLSSPTRIDTAPGGAGTLPAMETWVGARIDRARRTAAAGPPIHLSLAAASGEADPARLTHLGAEPGVLHAWLLDPITACPPPARQAALGLILVAMNCEPRIQDEFDDWYATEHLPLLSRVPGMISARRYRAVAGRLASVALYHVSDTAIYRHPTWLAANETPWIRRIRRFQRSPEHFMFGTRG